MSAGRPKGKPKLKMTISIDEQLRKDMAFIEKMVPVNWSDMIDKALTPAVRLMKEAIEELSKGELADLDKVKFMMQGNVVEFMGMAHKGLEGVDKDIEKAKVKRKKVKE